jgi:hypothetical protein
MAASAGSPGKHVRTLHTIFARAARVSADTELSVEPIHDGRSFASANVTAWQGERLCARSLVLLDAPDPDLIRHAAPAPRVDGPEQAVDAGPSPLVFPGAELRIVGGVDTSARRPSARRAVRVGALSRRDRRCRRTRPSSPGARTAS